MKKRRTAIVAFLLCAVLCLSVGYAALTDTLMIDGSANVALSGNSDNPGVEEVWETEVYLVKGTSAMEKTSVDKLKDTLAAEIAFSDDNDTATITATGFNAVGDTIVLYFAIQNDSDYKVKVTDVSEVTVTPQLTDAAFDFTVDSTKVKNAEIAIGATSEEIAVTITLKDVSGFVKNSTLEQIEDKFSITYTVEAVA